MVGSGKVCGGGNERREEKLQLGWKTNTFNNFFKKSLFFSESLLRDSLTDEEEE